MQIKYVNHLGETIDFADKNHFTNSVVMRDYAWNSESDFNRISRFHRDGVTSKSLTVSILAGSRDEANALFNSLYEIFEKDVLAKIPGKFYIGKYYFKGYVIGSKKEQYFESQNLLTLELTVVSDTNAWVREMTFNFSKNQPVSGHGYAYRYPYRYAAGPVKTFSNGSLADSDFKLRIYGPCEKPDVYLAGHLYSVDVLIEPSERVEIDSREKSMLKIQPDGSKVSVLNFRNRNNYIFQKIPSGPVSVAWNNDFGFDLTVYDERSEPLWEWN